MSVGIVVVLSVCVALLLLLLRKVITGKVNRKNESGIGVILWCLSQRKEAV